MERNGSFAYICLSTTSILMILLQDPISNIITPYRTLTECVKENPSFKYSYLKNLKLSNTPAKYKGQFIFRIKHT